MADIFLRHKGEGSAANPIGGVPFVHRLGFAPKLESSQTYFDDALVDTSAGMTQIPASVVEKISWEWTRKVATTKFYADRGDGTGPFRSEIIAKLHKVSLSIDGKPITI